MVAETIAALNTTDMAPTPRKRGRPPLGLQELKERKKRRIKSMAKEERFKQSKVAPELIQGIGAVEDPEIVEFVENVRWRIQLRSIPLVPVCSTRQCRVPKRRRPECMHYNN